MFGRWMFMFAAFGKRLNPLPGSPSMFTQNGAWDIIFAYRAVKEPGERDYGAFFIFRHRFFQPASPAGEPMITLICVGSLKEVFFREAVGEYEKRLLGYTKMAILSVRTKGSRIGPPPRSKTG